MADPKKLRADANALVVELLQRLGAEEVHELEVRRGPIRVRVSKDAVAVPSHAAAASGGVSISVPDAAAKIDYPTVNAPLTGIFYRSPSPQAPPFIQVGSQVTQGDVIGLIEAMKLFNEIRSTASGKVRRIMVENGQLVRAHQPILELE
jgi:acetyl-CoA carboxylase biotin carboxyl carrier protein